MFYTGSAWGDISRTLGELYGGGGFGTIDFSGGLNLGGTTPASTTIVDSGFGPGQGLARTNEQIKQAEETAKEIGTLEFKKTNLLLNKVNDTQRIFFLNSSKGIRKSFQTFKLAGTS